MHFLAFGRKLKHPVLIFPIELDLKPLKVRKSLMYHPNTTYLLPEHNTYTLIKETTYHSTHFVYYEMGWEVLS